MRISDTFKTPIHGVSTLAPRNRAEGHAEIQENLRSDPVEKLTRRPSLVFKQALMPVGNVADDYLYHEYRKDGTLFSIVVNATDGTVSHFKDYTLLSTSSAAAGYLAGGDIVLRTISDTTYLLNKDVRVLRGSSLDTQVKATHVNVTSALNYGEEVVLGIGSVNDVLPLTVVYSVPELGDPPEYDAADAARASKAVAKGLADALLAETWFTATYEVRVLGSSLTIREITGTDWVSAYIVTGQGDRSARVFGRVISDTDGLPLYGMNGTIITVRPNPVDSDGTYYLKAERVAETSVGTGTYLEEVVWAETRAPTETHNLDASTMPYVTKFDEDTVSFTVSADSWKDRRTGDDDSCPFPEFINERLVDLGQFQNRVVFIADGSVYMTETDDYKNWFKASAVKLLVTDPIGITSSAVDTEAIEHISSHNKDILLVAPNGQFKIDGQTAVTPQTVSMPKVSSYDCDTTVPPIPMGDSVMLAIKQGESAGVLDFTTRKRTQQEFGRNVSKHVVGLMAGSITRMVGSVNSDILVLTTTDSPSNAVYVFEMYDNADGTEIQNSWSTWLFPDDINIVDLVFTSDTLKVVTKQGGYISVYVIDLYSRVATTTDEVYLDYLLKLDSVDGDTVQLPSGYPFNAETIVVQGAGCEFELFKTEYTKVGDVITFKENLSNGAACSVFVGVPTKARYIPTRPFKRDKSGLVLTEDRIRIARWGLYVTDTHEVTARIISDYGEFDDQKFTGRTMGQTSNIIGKKVAFTGDLNFSYSQDANLAKIEFFTEGWLGLTISAVSWRGQIFKTSRGL